MRGALDAPALVGSLALLEPNLTGVPNIAAFNEEVRPAFAAYRKGDKETAVAHFLSVVAGMPWERCKALIERNVSGGAAQAVRDADTFFAIEIPALGQWMFTAEHAARITCPVLSALGGLSYAFFREARDLLRQWFPHLQELDVAGAGHLLQFQNPDALGSGLASFFARYPLAEQHRMAPTIQRTGPPGTAG